jgi:hypothetical protein
MVPQRKGWGSCTTGILGALTGAKVIEDRAGRTGRRHRWREDLAGTKATGSWIKFGAGTVSSPREGDAVVTGYWIERRVVGSCLIAGLAAFAGLEIARVSDPGLWQLAPVLLVLLVVSSLAYRTLVRPSVDCDRERIVVRNAKTEYTVPWGRVKRFDWNGRSGRLSVVLTDGKQVCLEAFSVWPTLGRHDQVKDELERLRREAPGQADPVPVSERQSAAWAGSLVTLAVAAALLALGVEGLAGLL